MRLLSQRQMVAAGYIPSNVYLKSWKPLGCRNQSRKSRGANRSQRILILNQNAHEDGQGKMQTSLSEVYSPTDWETFNKILKYIPGIF